MTIYNLFDNIMVASIWTIAILGIVLLIYGIWMMRKDNKHLKEKERRRK